MARRFRFAQLGLFTLGGLLAACGTPTTTPGASISPSSIPSAPASILPPVMAVNVPASPSPSATPRLTPSAAPNPSLVAGTLYIDFSKAALGAVPSDFVDITSESQTPAWVYPGNWKISADENGRHVLLHDDIRPQPALSFLRFCGDFDGQTGGVMPARYYAETHMRLLASPDFYPPTGDQAVQFFYLDCMDYLEVDIKPDRMEVWEAKNAAPGTTAGWTRLWYQAMDTAAGETRRIGALVDKRQGTFDVFLDGHDLGQVHSSLLVPQASWITLRGTGDTVSFADLNVQVR